LLQKAKRRESTKRKIGDRISLLWEEVGCDNGKRNQPGKLTPTGKRADEDLARVSMAFEKCDYPTGRRTSQGPEKG